MKKYIRLFEGKDYGDSYLEDKAKIFKIIFGKSPTEAQRKKMADFYDDTSYATQFINEFTVKSESKQKEVKKLFKDLFK